MVTAAGLNNTKKHFTNHSIRRTTVKKLKKAGVSASEIMAITGHTNQQSLADYDEIDSEDHIRLGKNFSYDKNEANKHEQYSMQQKYLQQYSTTGLVPVFNMQNCNITIETLSYQPQNLPLSYQPQNPKKRRCYIIDSDSE